ncbi:hypothetical protein HXZ87_17655 [Myroides sp. R163-1]|nr:hypothetical protein [Myroides sp. R163-1]
MKVSKDLISMDKMKEGTITSPTIQTRTETELQRRSYESSKFYDGL